MKRHVYFEVHGSEASWVRIDLAEQSRDDDRGGGARGLSANDFSQLKSRVAFLWGSFAVVTLNRTINTAPYLKRLNYILHKDV